ncbi:MAG: M20/M25/M40 family metallo-hydrolase [Bacteroidales bacterium]|nr:M20/M25/M40 family metallo-hydrolase [Bacteroidales bacterium]
MKKHPTLILFVIIAALGPIKAQTGGDSFMGALRNINENVLKAQLGFLASDLMEGRGTNTRGDYLASEYIASQLRLYGVAPGGDTSEEKTASGIPERTYFQNFPLIKSTRGEGPVMKIIVTDGKETIRTLDLAHNVDFLTRIPAQSLETEAPVVFVGFGIRNEKLQIDDFGTQDLRGKFVLKIAGSPGFLKDKMSISELSNNSMQAERIARQMGAAGIIEFDPAVAVSGTVPGLPFTDLAASEKRPGSGRPYADYSLPSAKTSDSFVRIMVSPRTAEELFRGSGFNTKEYVSRSADSYIRPQADLTGKKIFLKTTIKIETVMVRNVIGIIEGKDPSQIIVAGAHYDHIGMWNGYVWNGADDNGSGTVGIMTIAKAIMETGVKPEKTIIIALWAAEEEGLLGSRHFVANLPFPATNIRLNLNFDMISRYVSEKEYKKAYMVYTDSYPGFKAMTEKHLKRYGIDLDVEYQPSADPPGGSDHRSFVDAGIPVVRFKPGHREEYHTPEDEVSTVDWDIMQKIVRIGFANIWELANSEW